MKVLSLEYLYTMQNRMSLPILHPYMHGLLQSAAMHFAHACVSFATANCNLYTHVSAFVFVSCSMSVVVVLPGTPQ